MTPFDKSEKIETVEKPVEEKQPPVMPSPPVMSPELRKAMAELEIAHRMAHARICDCTPRAGRSEFIMVKETERGGY